MSGHFPALAKMTRLATGRTPVNNPAICCADSKYGVQVWAPMVALICQLVGWLLEPAGFQADLVNAGPL